METLDLMLLKHERVTFAVEMLFQSKFTDAFPIDFFVVYVVKAAQKNYCEGRWQLTLIPLIVQRINICL